MENRIVRRLGKWGMLATFVILIVPLLSVTPLRAATSQVVTTCADTGAGSLRAAIAAASSGATVTFGVDCPAANPITLASTITIDKSLTIDGAHVAIVSGGNAVRVFSVTFNAPVAINALTITRGNAGSDSFGGGGIASDGTLTITNSTITGNTAVRGGGIAIAPPDKANGSLIIKSSTISNNQASADNGGGIYSAAYPDFRITNSTISGNSALKGGGIATYFSANFYNCTIANNTASIGGGVYAYSVDPSILTGLTFSNTIAAGNTGTQSDPDVRGAVYERLGANLIGDPTGAVGFDGSLDLLNRDARLAPLANNGGPTQTMALTADSPAIDAGGDVGCSWLGPNGSVYPDQRGMPRYFCDIGAYEYAPRYPTVYVDPAATSPGTGEQNDPIASIALAVGVVAPGGEVRIIPGSYDERIVLDHNVTVTATGAVTLDRHGRGTVVTVNSGVTATMRGLTITNGMGSGSTGGGITNAGTLTVANGTLIGNGAQTGGGVYNTGTLALTDTTLSGNAVQFGGGVYNTGTLTSTGSTFTGNTATHSGGAIANVGAATVKNSTISGNTAALSGGGIDNAALLTVMGSTIAGNGANTGGGVYSNGQATLTAALIAANTVTGTGATGPDVAGNNISGTYNLIGDGTGLSGIANGSGGNLIGTAAAPIDARLAPLGANGGATQTRALGPTSPAIDAGGPPPCSTGTDQRGTHRFMGDACDIGAYEYVPATPIVSSITPRTLTVAGGAVTITGAGFQKGTQLLLDNTYLTPTIDPQGQTMTTIFPASQAHATTLQVANPGTLSVAASVTYAPTISAISSDSGPTAGGGTLTITGTGFSPGRLDVTFGNLAATVSYSTVTPTTITLSIPAHPVGAVAVTVTVNGAAATVPGGYTYVTVNALPPAKPAPPVSGTPNPLPNLRAPGPAGGNSSPAPLPPTR